MFVGAFALLGCASSGSQPEGRVVVPLASANEQGCSAQAPEDLAELGASVFSEDRIMDWLGAHPRDPGRTTAPLRAAFTVSLARSAESRWVVPIEGSLAAETMDELADEIRAALAFPEGPDTEDGPTDAAARDGVEAGDGDPDRRRTRYFRIEITANPEPEFRFLPTVHCSARLANQDEITRRLEGPGQAYYGASFRIEAFVPEDGVPEQIRIRDARGAEIRDAELRRIVRRMRFTPAQIDVVAVPVWVELPLDF